MNIELSKKITNARVIDGFPGFGLVASIASEFLVEHLKMEEIGKYWFEDQPSSVAIHDGKIINPITIYYNKKHNLVIVHSIIGTTGMEWRAAELINALSKKVKAKELISLEGIGGTSTDKKEEPNVYYYSQKNVKIDAKPLTEGVILGVSAALLLKSTIPITSFFVETHTQMPDSKGAALLVETLNKYLGLKVDTKPLLAAAEKFEEKFKDILSKSSSAMDLKAKKDLTYVG